jgi:hypothetical protein
MASRLPVALSAVLLGGWGAAPRAAAQVTALITSLGYESPSLVAPLLARVSSSASGARTWTVTLTGSALSVERTNRLRPTLATLMRLEVTPFNANSSNYVYRAGRRASDLGFRDRSMRFTAGLRVLSDPHWRTELQAIGLYESVAGLADPAVRARWREPHAGLALETSYRRIVSEEVLAARWDGVKVTARVVGFVGTEPWWRAEASLGAGKRIGHVMLRGTASLLTGHDLDIVNQHLVGGCWDLADGSALYGYHYAEFRLDRAVVLGGGTDVRVAGAWELRLRVGYLSSASRTTYGEAVSLATVWNGIGLNAGVGLPRGSLFQRASATPLVFAGVSAGVL